MAQVQFKAPQAEPNAAATAPNADNGSGIQFCNVFAMRAEACCGRIC